MSESVPRLPVDAPKEKIVADLLETGAVIVEGVLEARYFVLAPALRWLVRDSRR